MGEVNYRIAWYSHITQSAGFVSGLFTKERAEAVKRDLEQSAQGNRDYWIERAPDVAQEAQQ